MNDWLVWHTDSVTVTVRLTPDAGRNAIEPVEELSDGRRVLRARVAAVPEKGKANSALIALLAKTIKRPKSAVSLVSGGTGRMKVLRIKGDPTAIAERLRLLGSALDEAARAATRSSS